MPLEALLQRIEKRPIVNPPSVVKAKLENFENFYAISQFEDVVITPEAKKLNLFIAQGKITADQAVKIAIKYA